MSLQFHGTKNIISPLIKFLIKTGLANNALTNFEFFRNNNYSPFSYDYPTKQNIFTFDDMSRGTARFIRHILQEFLLAYEVSKIVSNIREFAYSNSVTIEFNCFCNCPNTDARRQFELVVFLARFLFTVEREELENLLNGNLDEKENAIKYFHDFEINSTIPTNECFCVVCKKTKDCKHNQSNREDEYLSDTDYEDVLMFLEHDDPVNLNHDDYSEYNDYIASLEKRGFNFIK